MQANLNICKYKPVRLCDEYGINARFNLLFNEVCAIKASTSIASDYFHFSITSPDFQGDGKTYLNPKLISNNTNIFWNDINRYIYRNQGEWDYVTGGVKILMTGFDANTSSYNLEITSK